MSSLSPTPSLRSNLNSNINSKLKPIVDKFVFDLFDEKFYEDIGIRRQHGHDVATQFAKDVSQTIADEVSEQVDQWLVAVTFTVVPGLHSIGTGAGPTGPIIVSTQSDIPYINIIKS